MFAPEEKRCLYNGISSFVVPMELSGQSLPVQRVLVLFWCYSGLFLAAFSWNNLCLYNIGGRPDICLLGRGSCSLRGREGGRDTMSVWFQANVPNYRPAYWSYVFLFPSFRYKAR